MWHSQNFTTCQMYVVQVTWNESNQTQIAYLSAIPMGVMVVKTMLALKQITLSMVLFAKKQFEHGQVVMLYSLTWCDMLPSSLIDSNVSLKRKQRKSEELRHVPWLVALQGQKRHARALGWGLGRVTNINYSHRLAQTKQQVGQCIVGALLVHGQATSKHELA